MHQELLKILTKRISKYYNFALDHIIAPPFCIYCKQFLTARSIFCFDCYDMIEPIVSVQLRITKSHSMNVMAACGYKEPVKSLILGKARSDKIASEQLGQLIWQYTYFKHLPCDYLVPIPLHWMRYAKRGYNQAEEIAHVLAREKNIGVENILYRTKNTPFQSSIAFDQRLENVKNVFSLKTNSPEEYYNKHFVIVDDLMTTGATLQSAAKALLPLKLASINAIVACRVI